jgi:hypothetical protein
MSPPYISHITYYFIEVQNVERQNAKIQTVGMKMYIESLPTLTKPFGILQLVIRHLNTNPSYPKSDSLPRPTLLISNNLYPR